MDAGIGNGPSASPVDGKNGESESPVWREWVAPVLKWAAEDPWNFVGNILLLLSPLIFVCMFLSYKLMKNIEQQKKEKKRVKRDAKGKRKKKDA